MFWLQMLALAIPQRQSNDPQQFDTPEEDLAEGILESMDLTQNTQDLGRYRYAGAYMSHG